MRIALHGRDIAWHPRWMHFVLSMSMLSENVGLLLQLAHRWCVVAATRHEHAVPGRCLESMRRTFKFFLHTTGNPPQICFNSRRSTEQSTLLGCRHSTHLLSNARTKRARMTRWRWWLVMHAQATCDNGAVRRRRGALTLCRHASAAACSVPGAQPDSLHIATGRMPALSVMSHFC